MTALAFDLGTGGPKVAVVEADGTVLGTGQVAVTTRFGIDGSSLQDPDEVWQAVVTASRAAIAASPPGTAGRIDVVSPTTQWSSITPVDADGMPVGPMMVWMDRRGGQFTRPLMRDGGAALWADINGLTPSSSASLGHVLYMQNNCPDIHSRTRAYLEPMDYLAARLTGIIATTGNSAMPFALSDNRTPGAWAWSPELISRSGVDPSRLPPFAPSLSVLGPLRAAQAQELGVRAGIDVVSGANDSIASAFGTGALGPGEGTVMMGTTAVLTSHHAQRFVDHEHFITTLPSALDDRYYVVAEGGLGGKAFEWFATQIGYADSGDLAVARASADAADAPPGSGGVMFAPWLIGAAAPSPDPRPRGAFVGLGLASDRACLARAVMEGVSMQVAWLLHEVAFPSLRFVGGGAISDTWAQALADVCAIPVEQAEDPRQANARGAGLLAHVARGTIALGDLHGLVRIRRTYQPQPHVAAMYADLRHVYTELHGCLAAPSARLQEAAP